MSLDSIWQQQLTLVTYGNEYLRHNLSFQRWLAHGIFNGHSFGFRDLSNQHLLAQHFQVWLEALKKQGVKRLSLHSSTLLADEKNPNPNIELLATPHIIVSHQDQQKTAWIFGKELAEWDNNEQDFIIPMAQQPAIRLEVLWSFTLNNKLAKRIEADLIAPQWDEIAIFLEQELFSTALAQNFESPTDSHIPYYGQQTEVDLSSRLSLLPTDYAADYAHYTLYRLDALSASIQTQIQHPYHAEGHVLTPEEQLHLRHFAQKIDELTAKFIVKVANYYQTAQLTAKISPNPFSGTASEGIAGYSTEQRSRETSQKTGVSNSSANVLTLIVITVIICLIGYYFGL